MGTLVTLSSSVFPLLILAAEIGFPKFIVPNHPDLTVKTHYTSGDWLSQVHTLYLKGARERFEVVYEHRVGVDPLEFGVIRQCDEKRIFNLNERDRIYASLEMVNWSERLSRARQANLPQVSGPEVQMTIDSIDTGERRQYKAYAARHVKGTIRIEPTPGASTPASVEETDGWYMDLPGFGCQEQSSNGFARLSVSNSRREDRWHVEWLGKAPRGYVVEETTVITAAGKKTISKVELLEISEGPLNPAIFELPAGYRLALQTGHGGADLTKANTLTNRAEYYWERMGFWARSLFHR